MFNEVLGEISEGLICPYIDESDMQVAQMTQDFAIQNKKLPSLIDCMEEVEFYNTQIIDTMIETYMEHGEGYILCSGPKNTWDDCSRCESFSACYSSILDSNIMPYFREIFDDTSLTAMIFWSMRYSGTSIRIDKYSHRLYGDFVDCFMDGNQDILDNFYFLNDDQVVYANHCQMTMFDDLFINTQGSVFKFGDNTALIYRDIDCGQVSFYLGQEDKEYVRIETNR